MSAGLSVTISPLPLIRLHHLLIRHIALHTATIAANIIKRKAIVIAMWYGYFCDYAMWLHEILVNVNFRCV
jgi:hypothetical protein